MYVFAALGALALGAVAYLRVRPAAFRFAALGVSLLFAWLLVAFGKWMLIPSQAWPFPITDGLRWGEVKDTLLSGMWMLVAVLGFPALLQARRGPSHGENSA